MSSRPVRWAGGAFATTHQALMGIEIDFSALDLAAFEPALVQRARAVWMQRVRTEFRSIQIMARFVTEVVGAGDPLDVYAGAVDLVSDEVRHAALCARLVEALGGRPLLPDPVAHRLPDGLRRAPMGERALNTAITMLLINETLSVAYITDLAARCRTPVIRDVLQATLADEAGHEAFGWAYVEQSLRRFPRSTLPAWRGLVQQALASHRASADRHLGALGPEQLRLEAWPEPELADLGLFGPQRQHLVFREAWRARLAPGLTRLELL